MGNLREDWGGLYRMLLTDMDVKCIGDALLGLFSLLRSWDNEEAQKREKVEMKSDGKS